MTTTFTASNGTEIEITEIGGIFAKSGYGHIQAGPGVTKALREYFQHERDQKLNRWRNPKHSNHVVYRWPDLDRPGARAVRVIDEASGNSGVYWENTPLSGEGTKLQMRKTAARYFKAHPETKPWDEAEPGEVWELTGADGLKQAWVRSGTEGWVSINAPKVVYYDGKGVTAGRRIWPDEGDTNE